MIEKFLHKNETKKTTKKTTTYCSHIYLIEWLEFEEVLSPIWSLPVLFWIGIVDGVGIGVELMGVLLLSGADVSSGQGSIDPLL